MRMKRCTKCGGIKPISEFHHDRSRKDGRFPQCKTCISKVNRSDATRAWTHRTGRALPMSDNRDCAAFLGVHIAERALTHVFEDVERMPFGNPGYDFICKRGYKIDVKSACIRSASRGRAPNWMFNIYRNKAADFFLCIAFDDRDNLNPMHVWLIPGEQINHLTGLGITEAPKSLEKWRKFERPIDKAVFACDRMRTEVATE